jgi:hypothetical protein
VERPLRLGVQVVQQVLRILLVGVLAAQQLLHGVQVERPLRPGVRVVLQVLPIQPVGVQV